MDFDLNEKQTYWRDRIREHNERFIRPRVKAITPSKRRAADGKFCKSLRKKRRAPRRLACGTCSCLRVLAARMSMIALVSKVPA